jgi:hypothetical protein
MNKLVQFAVALVLALLAAQPLVAAINCAPPVQAGSACSDPCCAQHGSHAMQKHAHCRTNADADPVTSECGQNACSSSDTTASAQAIKPGVDQPHSGAGASRVAASVAVFARSGPAHPIDLGAAAATTPRHILIQVFRI